MVDAKAAGELFSMWETVVAAAQSQALHWTVVGGALAAFVFRMFTSPDRPLMGDLFGDEFDL
jgi:hypothetical protein